jgi:hypothetical protein
MIARHLLTADGGYECMRPHICVFYPIERRCFIMWVLEPGYTYRSLSEDAALRHLKHKLTLEVNICRAAEWGFCNNGVFQCGVHKAFLASCGPISIRVGWYLAAGNKYNFVSSGICYVESPIFISKDNVPDLSSIARVRFLHITVYAIWRWP